FLGACQGTSVSPKLPGPLRIAFTSHRALSVINADGSNLVRLTETDSMNPVWSPDSRQIAFSTLDSVDVINADGTDRVQLFAGNSPSEVAWSPDGSRLAFSPYAGIGSGELDIIDMQPPALKKTRRLVDHISATQLAWSPDSKHLAFTFGHDIDKPTQIMLVDPDSPRELDGYYLYGVTDGTDLAWSPNGKQIAFSTNPNGPGVTVPQQIMVMNADGSSPKQLTSDHFNVPPIWSPDGKHILVISTRNGIDGDLYVMNPDGTDQKRLTSGINLRQIAPAWSPDGQYIAFIAGDPANLALDVMNADGSNIRELTKPVDDFGPPVWAPR
ncbi:MAG: hypothetical protein WCF84_21830, partial [Anaerolineae bacterium]